MSTPRRPPAACRHPNRKRGSAPFAPEDDRQRSSPRLLVAFAIGGGVTAAALQARRPSLVMLTPAPITSMRDWSEVAVKGQVAEIFGNKFIVQDDSGRALVDTGRSGESGKLVAKSENVTVQGRFEHGFIHAQASRIPMAATISSDLPDRRLPRAGLALRGPAAHRLRTPAENPQSTPGSARQASFDAAKRRLAMKALLISGLTLALLTGGALAQANGQPPAPPAPGDGGPAAPAASAPASRHHLRPLLALRRRPCARAARKPGTTWTAPRRLRLPADPVLAASALRRRRRPRPRIFACSAATRLVDVKCADEEPMKACADLALQMVDRLQTLRNPDPERRPGCPGLLSSLPRSTS